MVGGEQQKSAVQAVTSNSVAYHYSDMDYMLRLPAGSCQQMENGDIRLRPDSSGKLTLMLNFAM
jgi:hypothetical protein